MPKFNRCLLIFTGVAALLLAWQVVRFAGAADPVPPTRSPAGQQEEIRQLREELRRLTRVLDALDATRDNPSSVKAEVPVELRRYEGHGESILSLAVTPDGKQILSSGFDSTVRLWDLASGKELHRRQGPGRNDSAHVNQLAISKDGKLALLGGGYDIVGGNSGIRFRLSLWDLQSWKELQQLQGHEGVVNAVAFSPDGRFAICSGGKTRLWNLQTGKEVHQLGDEQSGVRTVDYSPNGLEVVTGGNDGNVRFWEVDSGKEIRKLTELGHVASVAYSPDGKFLAVAGNELTLWDTATNNKVRTWQTKTGSRLNTVSFSPDGRQVVSTGLDRDIRIWDIERDTEIATVKGHTAPATQAVFTPDGKHLVSGSFDRTLRLWSLAGTSGANSPAESLTAKDFPALKLGRVSGSSGGFGWSQSLGWEFEVTQPLTVTELGIWDRDGSGLNVDTEVGLWDPKGKLLATAKVPAGSSTRLVDKFRYAPIKPCELETGGPYVIAALYTPQNRESVISSNGGIEFASAGPIRWLKARRAKSEALSLPEPSKERTDELPGCFGPNFLIADASQKQIGTWHRVRETYPLGTLATFRVEPNADGSIPEEMQPTASLFALKNGRLTQVMLDQEPLGTGEEAFRKLKSEVQRLYPSGPERPFIRVAAMSSVKFEDVRSAVEAVGGSTNPGVGRRSDLLSLTNARVKQGERDGKFVAPDRFRDAGAYLEDRWTGLLWQKDGKESGKKNFYQAGEYAESLEIGGLKGWRVPKAEELRTIYPANFEPFTNTQYRPDACCQGPGDYPSYWTGELDLRTKDYAFVFQWYEKGGANNGYASRNFAYVRCVHDPLD